MGFNITKKYNDADPRKLPDWQVAEIAEETMPTIDEWQDKLGLKKDEIIPMGKLCRLDFMKVIDRLKDRPDESILKLQPSLLLLWEKEKQRLQWVCWREWAKEERMLVAVSASPQAAPR